MTVAEIMTRDVITVEMDDSVDRARRFFEARGFHHLLVVDGGRLVGVVSDRDLLRTLSPFVGKSTEREQDAATLRRRIHLIMSRRLVTVTSEMSVEDAARSMLTNKVSCLPVVDAQSRPIGVVT